MRSWNSFHGAISTYESSRNGGFEANSKLVQKWIHSRKKLPPRNGRRTKNALRSWNEPLT